MNRQARIREIADALQHQHKRKKKIQQSTDHTCLKQYLLPGEKNEWKIALLKRSKSSDVEYSSSGFVYLGTNEPIKSMMNG